MTGTRPIPWLRLAAILAVGVYVQVGPIGTQLFAMKRSNYFKTWMMYRSFARDICRVKYVEHSPEGPVQRDRMEVVAETWEAAPGHIKFIPNPAQVARTGRFMCRRIGPGTHLTVTGECGSHFSWKPLARLEGLDLCKLTDEQLGELGAKPKKKRSKAKAKP